MKIAYNTDCFMLRDPLTESKVEICSWNFDYTVPPSNTGILSFRINKGTPFFTKIKDQPIRLQGYPFFLDILTENRTELIVVDRVCNGFNVTDNNVEVMGCEVKYIDNLEFFKKIQYQRWLYNDKD